jgi:hypothetical protein
MRKWISYVHWNKGALKYNGHFFLSNCLLKHVIAGEIEVKLRREKHLSWCFICLRKWENTRNWRGRCRSHWGESLFWERLWTCRKTDYEMNECLPVAKFHAQFYTTEIPCAVKECSQITDNCCELNATTRFSQDQYNKYCRQSEQRFAWMKEAVYTVV